MDNNQKHNFNFPSGSLAIREKKDYLFRLADTSLKYFKTIKLLASSNLKDMPFDL